ncbi:MAG: hypothetical protein KAY04_04975 [Burkholderiales bacterium]|nr:hypothetical protein [Burkholderiales bacterium]
MTVCPIAIVAGCQKCPAFKICPLKGVLGDAPPKAAAPVAMPKTRTASTPRKPAARKAK